MGCRMRCAHIPVLFLAPLKGEPARAERSASRVRHIGLCLIGCRPLATRLVPLQLRAYIVRDPSVSHFVPDSSPFRGSKIQDGASRIFYAARSASERSERLQQESSPQGDTFHRSAKRHRCHIKIRRRRRHLLKPSAVSRQLSAVGGGYNRARPFPISHFP